MSAPGEVLLNDGTATFTAANNFANLGADTRDVATGDFDADGYADVVVSVPGAQLIFVCYGSSAGVGLRNQRWTADTVAARSTTIGLGFGRSFTTADFNGDGIVNGADLSVLLGRFGSAC